LSLEDPWPEADVILDALLGYSASGAPRPPLDQLVRSANKSGTPILALDIPTGLDPDNGRPSDPTIRAAATLTLALPKAGLLADGARDYVGELWLADLGIPPSLYGELGLEVPADLFSKDDIIRLL
jgi:NAD(P)H-hydrate epimerase